MSSCFFTGEELHSICNKVEKETVDKISTVFECHVEGSCSGYEEKRNDCRWHGKYILADTILLCEVCDSTEAKFLDLKSGLSICKTCSTKL